MEHDFLSLSSGRLQGETRHIKESPNRNLCSISSIIQSHFWYQIQAFAAVFRNWWDWFLQMENAILGRNLPVFNFMNHLPTPWTKWFVHVNGKQPVTLRFPPLFGSFNMALWRAITFVLLRKMPAMRARKMVPLLHTLLRTLYPF